MSSEPEKDKERLVQAAKMFFFHIKNLNSFTNTLIKLFNYNMSTQILLVAVQENSNIQDFFEQMLKTLKDMRSVVDEKYSSMQMESLSSKIATAMSSVVEKNISVKELQDSAKEIFKNVQTPVIVSALHAGNILGSLESSLSLLMKLPIMNLQLSDFYREDAKEQSDATTSKKGVSPSPSQTTSTDILKKLQEALKIKNADNSLEAAADLLEQTVKDMGPIVEVFQKAVNIIETDATTFKKVEDK
ncbi:uncharacterized protein C12orf60 homolog [Nycticebus coucang]|uniref:uncharacterized protein C12orf60 homolog n=1 Tax=Nycticebus coucang TaxID=9470 RepID=UPI00234CCA93|nr:uncharacterized protein C12orf60 homolog [Nycticebus coucang]